MKSRHKQIKPGEPPCQCKKCLALIRRLGGELPLLTIEGSAESEMKKRKRRRGRQ